MQEANESSVDASTRRPRFTALYLRWSSVVWAAARERLSCDADADDATQCVFLRLWRRGPTAWRPRSPESYFHRAGRNEALMLLRQRARQIPLDGVVAATLPTENARPDEAATRSELREILARCIADLPPRCRAVMSLILLDGLTHPEIAERLGITIGAVQKQSARGRRLLWKQLQLLLGDEGIEVSSSVDGRGGMP